MEINIRNSQGDRVLPVVQNMAAWGDTVSTWKLTCNSQGDGWVLSVVQNMAVWGDTISTWKRWIKLRTEKQKEIKTKIALLQDWKNTTRCESRLSTWKLKCTAILEVSQTYVGQYRPISANIGQYRPIWCMLGWSSFLTHFSDVSVNQNQSNHKG